MNHPGYVIIVSRIEHKYQGFFFLFLYTILLLYDLRNIVQLMDGIVSSRTRQDKFLFNHDIYSDRYTFSVEIVPICYGDLIFLPPKVASSLGNISPIIIC